MSARFRNLRIIFEYNNSSFIDVVDQYKHVSFLKKQAKNHFYHLPTDFKLIYQGKDISKQEDAMVSQLFHGKQSVRLQCVPSHALNISTDLGKKTLPGYLSIPEPAQQNEMLMYSMSGKRGIGNINEMYFNPAVLSRSQKMKLSTNKKLKGLSIKHKLMTEKNKSINTSQNETINSRGASHSPDDRESQIISTTQPLNYTNKLLESEQTETNNPMYICACKNYKISQFCRTCNKYICNPCRLNDVHKTHSAISINVNDLENSVKNIIQVIRKELVSRKKTINVNYFHFKQSQLEI